MECLVLVIRELNIGSTMKTNIAGNEYRRKIILVEKNENPSNDYDYDL
jgi:hypothetical protein